MSFTFRAGTTGDDLIEVTTAAIGVGGGINWNISGLSGNDTIQGNNLGTNILDGGDGIDTLSFTKAVGNVTISLAVTSQQNIGGGGFDTVLNFENLTGSDFNDSLTGDGGANFISGGLGSDTIEGGPGDDVINGGDGFDFASYEHATGGVTVSLAAGAANQVTGGAGTDVLLGIDAIIGSAFNDNLRGDQNGNSIFGGLGDDTIDGGGGDDTLDGGAGNDTLSYSFASANLTVSLALTRPQATGGEGTDTVSNFENLTGGAGHDRLVGNGSANIISGGQGNDTINAGAGDDTIDGGGGDDTIDGGVGNDTLDGGAGNDTLNYGSANGNIIVSLAITTPQVTGGAGTDTVLNFEYLIGGAGNDSLTGDAGNNVIYGMDGDDTIVGGAGNDTLDGITGINTVSYAASAGNIVVNLSLEGAQFIGGGQGTDTLGNFANLIGGAGNDNLTGSYVANVISAGAGNDTITGGLGNDSIDGGVGTDLAIFSGAQAGYQFGTRDGVVMIGGTDGVDQLTNVELIAFGGGFAVGIASLKGTTADQGLIFGNIGGSTGYVLPDVYTGPVAGLQNQLLGSAGSDTVLGTDRADFINALAGDDAVNGGGGNDVIDGGLGSNFLTGGAGSDTFFVDGRGAAEFNTWSTITDFDVAAGEAVSIFGYKPGVSQYVFVENDGTAGFKGITMHWDLDGNGLIDTSVTLAGLTQANLHTPLFGADYIYIY